MATTTRTSHKLPTPAPVVEYLDLTRMLARRARIVTGIYDLSVLVVDEPFGAPARFVPATREVHIHRDVLAAVNQREIHSVAELNAKHPEITGAFFHELFHAMFSMDAAQMEHFQKQHGSKLYGAFAVLDEGRIESLGYPKLEGIEQEALRAMVPEFVLRDVNPEEETDELVKSIKQGIRLIALLAARADAEILDMENPRCAAIWSGTIQAMGEWFSPFFDIALRFARVRHTDRAGLEELTELAQEWEDLAKALIEQTTKPKDKRKGEPCDNPDTNAEGEEEEESTDPSEEEGEEEEPGGGDEGEEESPDAQGNDEGEGDSDDESESKGQGEGDEDEETESEEDPSLSDGGEGTDEGQEGEGSGPSPANDGDDENEPTPTLGEYEGSQGEEGIDIETIRQLVKDLPEASQEQREVSGKKLKQAEWNMARTFIADHDERRRKNQEAASRWAL